MEGEGIRADPGILDRAEPRASQLWMNPPLDTSAATPADRAFFCRAPPPASGEMKKISSGSATSRSTVNGSNRPTLPAIYHTVKKLKQSKLVVHHLNRGGISELDCTNPCAFSSKAGQVGVNNNDKRHNYTTHRHDHANYRNISFSFTPATLICSTFPREHRVLRRTVEGVDVGMDNPPVFILMDQNFPPMVPAEGEGECLKIIQVENGSLADLVEVFLRVTRGFDVPAGAVVLIASASHGAAVAAADYAVDLVRASCSLQGAFAGSVMVLNRVPFLLGGIDNTAALRAITEIEQWIKNTSGNDTISVTRAIFKDSITAGSKSTNQHTLIRLPLTQTSTEKCTFESMGFGILKMEVNPIKEDFERYLIGSLIDKMNTLFPLSLATDFVCDRFLEEGVFCETMNPTALVLIGASHLGNMARLIVTSGWQIFDLTTHGWRISELSV